MARRDICVLCRQIPAYLRCTQCSIQFAPYRYLFPNMYLYEADNANPDFIGCCCRTWLSLAITRSYEEIFQPFSGSAGAVGVDTICTADCQTVVRAPSRVGNVVWNPCNCSAYP